MNFWICGFLLKRGRFAKGYNFKENQLSISKKLSITNRSLTEGWTLCLSPWYLSWVELSHVLCMCSWLFLVHICTSLLCLKNTVSLLSPTVSECYNLFASSAIIPESCEEWMWGKWSIYDWALFIFLFSIHLPIVDIHVNWYLPQIEASLMKAKRCNKD